MNLGFPIPTRHGWGLLLPVLPLCAASLVILQTISDNDTGRLLAPETTRQLAWMMLGLAGMVASVLIGYQRLGRIAFPVFFICLAMLIVLVLDRKLPIPFVTPRQNVRRWIGVGSFQIQPSELMKIAYVLALAWYLRYRRNYRRLSGLVPPFTLTLLPMALILIQPNLGTVLLFLPVLFAMLFAAGAKGRHLVTIAVLALLATPLFWFKIETYQRLRVTGVFLQSDSVRHWFREHPEAWDRLRPRGSNSSGWRLELSDWATRTGYQLVHSKTAIGSGGISGQGRDGVFVESNLLPLKHNDFIFAMIGHQWGLIGSLLALGCYTMIVVMGFDVATFTNDPFGRLVAVGLSTMLAAQTLTNVCMTIGMGPITGVTLPFVSAGGSSMVTSFIAVGLLISVAHLRPMLIARPPFVFDEEAERYDAPTGG